MTFHCEISMVETKSLRKMLLGLDCGLSVHVAAVMNSIWMKYLNAYDGHCGYILVLCRWFV